VETILSLGNRRYYADGKVDLAIINSPGSMAEGKGKNGMTVLLGDGPANSLL